MVVVLQSGPYLGQRSLDKVSLSSFNEVTSDHPLSLIPPAAEHPESTIYFVEKIFIASPGRAAAEKVVDFLSDVTKKISLRRLSLSLSSLDISTVKTIADALPTGVEFGISDLDAASLRRVLDAGVKVSFCQLDADACCALPPDMLALSREAGIPLVAHHDVAPGAEYGDVVCRGTSLYETRQVIAYTVFHRLA